MTNQKRFHLYTIGVISVTVYLLVTEVGDRWYGAWNAYAALEAKRIQLSEPSSSDARKQALQAEITTLRASRIGSYPAVEQSETGLVEWLGKAAKKSSIQIESLAPVKGDDTGVMRMLLTISGEYHGIGSFLNALESGPIPVKSEKLDLSTLGKGRLLAKLELQSTLRAPKGKL